MTGACRRRGWSAPPPSPERPSALSCSSEESSSPFRAVAFVIIGAQTQRVPGGRRSFCVWRSGRWAPTGPPWPAVSCGCLHLHASGDDGEKDVDHALSSSNSSAVTASIVAHHTAARTSTSSPTPSSLPCHACIVPATCHDLR